MSTSVSPDRADAEAIPLDTLTTASVSPTAPLAEGRRIEALDVVRGFALLGIFLMNIEWFNRPFAAFSEGMPQGLTGVDWLASWFIAYFVQGKFWTIFSTLFGMGFAVMLVRAERAGRPFVRVYLRRILALAVFGALHYLFIWNGDILFSYAVGALALLIVLYGRAKPIVLALLLLIGAGLVWDVDAFFRVAGGVATFGAFGLYLRGRRRVTWRGRSLPVFSVMLMLAGTVMSIVAAVLWALPDGPTEPRVPLSVIGPLLLVVGWLSHRYYDPAEQRSVRMAVALYLFAGVTMTAMSMVQYVAPDPDAATAASASSPADKARAAQAMERKAEREKRLATQAEEKREEVRILTTGTWLEAVAWRGGAFVDKAAGDAGFAVVLVAMFLIGVWFVRSGVMEDTAKHLAFFHKLARYGLPLGIGLGLLSCLIATSHVPGDRHDGWGIARGLVMLGNLPASLGYIGLVVTMLHGRSGFARIRVLAPAGRMALTNYLTQSIVCMFVFDGIGLGLWGIPRAAQVLFVLVVFAAQVVFSTWWLARFRYGPMEWLWRGFTYGGVPVLRVGTGRLASGEA